MNARRRLLVSALLGLHVLGLAMIATTTAQHGTSQAGAARTRRLAALGLLPSPGEIVVEHIVNYHRHGIPLPRAGEKVAVDLRWDSPFQSGSHQSVLQIGLATAELHDLTHARPINLALVIDCSGSMAADDKMNRVKAALRRFANRLRATDQIAVIAYSTEAAVVLKPSILGRGARLRDVIERLQADGSTNLHAGLMLGYDAVARHREADATNRVILLTDGIANAGVTDPERIAADSARMNKAGIDLSVIGVGVDLNHELLRQLAKSGRGLHHFVADKEDISKVFDREVQSLIGIVARDLELHVSHGAGVRLDRIYGYDSRPLENGCRIRLADFNHGVTNVVLLKFSRTTDRDWDAPPRVQVRLSYECPDRARERVAVERSTLFPRATESAANPVDHEVRKNLTIAVMARALRTMAKHAAAHRYGDAERCLCLALDFTRQYYPGTRDADLLRTQRMLERYREVLSARIERFRDL